MNESEVFSAALVLPPAERGAYLDRACSKDAALRGRLASLLAAHEAAAAFLQAPDGEPRPDRNAPLPPAIGPYDILEKVGSGGMGTVYRAFDPKLQRVVALKLLSADLAANAVARRRFEREARMVAAIAHPHVVVIHAVDEAHRPPYLVMEFVRGRSLAEKLSAEGALPLAVVLRIAAQTAEGLAAAHRQGVIHRDVKPANILLENGVERVKLTDFGLAKVCDDAGLSRSGEISGTPLFMSPEQCRGERLDQRSDLFSLGAVIFTMAAGANPFQANSALAVMRNICEQPAPRLKDSDPSVPDWLSELTGRLLERSPERRLSSAAELAETLHARLALLQGPASSGNGPGFGRAARRWSASAAWAFSASLALLLVVAVGIALRAVTSPDGAPGDAPSDNPQTSTIAATAAGDEPPADEPRPADTIDLLPLFDPDDPDRRGEWRLGGGVLVGTQRPGVSRAFGLPLRGVELPSRYRLSIACRRFAAGSGALIVGLESGGSKFFVRIDHVDEGKRFINILSGDESRKRLGIHRRAGAVLRPGFTARLVFDVSPQALVVEADDVQIYRWEGDFSQLSRGSKDPLETPIVIGGWPSEFAFSEITLQTLEP